MQRMRGSGLVVRGSNMMIFINTIIACWSGWILTNYWVYWRALRFKGARVLYSSVWTWIISSSWIKAVQYREERLETSWLWCGTKPLLCRENPSNTHKKIYGVLWHGMLAYNMHYMWHYTATIFNYTNKNHSVVSSMLQYIVDTWSHVYFRVCTINFYKQNGWEYGDLRIKWANYKREM